MRIVLALLVVAFSLSASAQYCGTSSSASCTPDSSLSSPGLTDYHNFPCASQGIAFSETMQLYVPTTVTYLGYTVPVDSIKITSITNLPCGLCWSANKASLTYGANERGCINISGITTDSLGTYSLALTGIAYTGMGTFPGSLNTYWGNFYVFVKEPTAACNHAVTSLKTACNAPTPCTIIPQVIQTSPAPCTMTNTIALTVGAPYASQIWSCGVYTSIRSSFTWSSNLSQNVTLSVVDSAGCTGSIPLVMNYLGAFQPPQICYFTSDTSLPSANVIVACERNDIFQTASFYSVYVSDSGDFSAGHNLDSIPVSSQAIFRDSSIHRYYLLQAYLCGEMAPGLVYSEYSRLTVDSTSTGYPQLTWPLQLPVAYSSVYVMAREQGGSWQVIDSIFGINGTNLQVTYVDHYPTAAHMDYMLGYNLTNTCDPSRSVGKTVFTNAAKSVVRSALVTSRPSGPTSVSHVAAETFLDLYPNPVTGTLHIHLSGTPSPAIIAVYDMLGNVVYSAEVRTEQVDVDISGYAQGIYMVKASQQGKVIVIKKVIKD